MAAAAGRNLKKTVLELGGSDPYLILEDADIERAAAVSTAALNGGQSCIAGKRFIVVSSVKLRQPCPGQHQADLLGIITLHLAEILRQHIDGTEQGEADQDIRGRAEL